MKKLLLLLVLLSLFLAGCMQIEKFTCGNEELAENIPKTLSSMELTKVEEEGCKTAETRMKSLYPKMKAYAAGVYKLKEFPGIFEVQLIEFENEEDSEEALAYIKTQIELQNFSIQEFGLNKVYWGLSDGTFYGTAWKSKNIMITIDNRAAPHPPQELISTLLAEYPSDIE